MGFAAFATAVFALLFVPGPTNALMSVTGAHGGLRSVLRVLPVVVASYLATVLLFVWAGAELLETCPSAAVAVKIATAAWVVVLAVKLWNPAAHGASRHGVAVREIAVTSALNPKALVLGLILVPRPDEPEFLPRLFFVCAMVALAALTWGAIGIAAQAGDAGPGRMNLIRRAASVLLGLISLSLVADVIAA